MSGGEATARRPAHLALAHAIVIAPFGAAASVIAEHACHAAKGYPVDLTSAWASAVTTAALLCCYLLVEELARGRPRWQALALFVTFAIVHSLLLYSVFGALLQHLMWGTSHRGGWPLLDVWHAVVDQLKAHWSGGNLRGPVLLSGLPLLGLAVARGVLRLPGWAQPLVVVAATLVGGALFGGALSSAADYPRETWGAVIASSMVMFVPGWAATPFGLRVGDRVAPWLIARLAADLTRDRSSA